MKYQALLLSGVFFLNLKLVSGYDEREDRENKNKKGQSIVELALLLPVLVLLLFGILEFGRVYSAYMMISHSARDGVRIASVGGTNAEIEAAIYNSTSPLNSDNLSITISKSGSGSRGDTVTVIVGYDITIVGPFISGLVDNPLHLESAMFMRME